MFGLKKKIENYTANKKQVYIIPSKAGFRYIAVNFFLFLIAISYANNLVLLITFLMVTFLILQMFSIHRIINNIQFENITLANFHADQDFNVRTGHNNVIPQDSAHYIQIELMGKKSLKGQVRQYLAEGSIHFKMDKLARGHYQFNRIKFFTYGATKLFYVWRYFPLNKNIFVYPKKLKYDLNNTSKDKSDEANQHQSEFSHHQRYQYGMNSKRIDWKLYAKTDRLYSKLFVDNESSTQEVNYHQIPGDKETRLAHMSYLIDSYSKVGIYYKVNLPNIVIPSNKGFKHYQDSMEALSVY